jgi:hypothetical protein
MDALDYGLTFNFLWTELFLVPENSEHFENRREKGRKSSEERRIGGRMTKEKPTFLQKSGNIKFLWLKP